MTAATITQASYNPPQTIAGFASALAAALTTAGMGSPIDTWTASNGDLHNTFQITGSSAAKGTIFFDIWVTNNTSYQRQTISAIYDTWNTSTHVGTNASAAYSYSSLTQISITNNQPIVLTSINHPELKIVVVTQSGFGSYHFGLIRPLNIPSWWNEAVYPYFFMVNTTSGSSILSAFTTLAAALTPWNSAGYLSYMKDSSFLNPNPVTGKRSELPGLIMTTPSTNTGDAGKTSNDLVIVSAASCNMWDTFPVTPGVEEYTLLIPATSSAFAIRSI